MHKTCRFFASKSDFDKTKAGAFKASAFVLYLLSCRNFLDCAVSAVDLFPIDGAVGTDLVVVGASPFQVGTGIAPAAAFGIADQAELPISSGGPVDAVARGPADALPAGSDPALPGPEGEGRGGRPRRHLCRRGVGAVDLPPIDSAVGTDLVVVCLPGREAGVDGGRLLGGVAQPVGAVFGGGAPDLVALGAVRLLPGEDGCAVAL